MVFEGRLCFRGGKGVGAGRRKGTSLWRGRGRLSLIPLSLLWMLALLIAVVVGLIMRDPQARLTWCLEASPRLRGLVGVVIADSAGTKDQW